MNSLSAADRALVRRSFRHVAANHQRISDHFFKRLFALDAQTEKLFARDMNRQRHKFMYMLALIVSTMDDPAAFERIARDMGLRHAQYGVQRQHFDLGRDALLYALEEQLGQQFTVKLREAWARLYDHFVELGFSELDNLNSAYVE